MGIILTFLLISCGITYLVYRYGDSNKHEGLGTDVLVSTIVCGVMSGLLIAFISGISYDNYIDMRTKYDATIAQYKGAITMYGDRAHIDVEKAALVNFKYKGYQDNMSSFIRDLRREIVSYNRGIISKRIMNRNFMFGWLVIAPDKDMKVINMVE